MNNSLASLLLQEALLRATSLHGEGALLTVLQGLEKAHAVHLESTKHGLFEKCHSSRSERRHKDSSIVLQLDRLLPGHSNTFQGREIPPPPVCNPPRPPYCHEAKSMPLRRKTNCTSNNCFEAPANGVDDHSDGGWSAEADAPLRGEIDIAGAQPNSLIGCHLEFSDLVHAHGGQHDNSMQRRGSDHRTDRINVASPLPFVYDERAVMMQEDVRSQECRHWTSTG